MRRSTKGELAFIEWLRRHTPAEPAQVPVGPGDDAAVVRLPDGGALLFTTDTILEGTHFIRSRAPYRLIGRKAAASALSDIAAMGGRALGLVAAVALPRRTRMQAARQLHRGITELAAECGVTLVGGDVTTWQGPLAVTVSVVGVPAGEEPVLRRGARVGDLVLVTGELGGSLLGRHLRFTPRLREGEWLGRRGCVHAMIDLSDGLATDLGHILRESGCGAVIDTEHLPVSAAARRLAQRTGLTPLEHALGDGEDYELCFTATPEETTTLLRDWPFETRLTVIGRIVERGCWLEEADGTRRRLQVRGYEHTFGEDPKRG